MSAERFAPLAAVWYQGRLDPGYEPRSQEESQKLLTEHGLVGEFWTLQ